MRVKKNLSKVVADGIRLERKKVTHDVANTVPSQMKDDEGLFFHTRDHKDHHDDARPEGDRSAKRQKTSKRGTFIIGESSSLQAMNESTPSCSSTQEQLEDFNAWKDDQCIDDDEVPSEEVSPKLLDEVSMKVMTSDEL
ncbi:hypothetical protein Tco_0513736 [Tanacetum coccineum]